MVQLWKDKNDFVFLQCRFRFYNFVDMFYEDVNSFIIPFFIAEFTWLVSVN